MVKETFRSPPGTGSLCVSSPARHIYSNGAGTINEVSANKSEICAFDNNYTIIGGSSGGGAMDMNANAVSYQINTSNNTLVNGNKNSASVVANNLNNTKGQAAFNTIGYLNSPAKVLRFQQQQVMNGNTSNNNGSATLQNIYNSPKHIAYNAPLNKLINESMAVDSAIVSNGKMTPETMQLKFENEKLRQALQQRSVLKLLTRTVDGKVLCSRY